MWCGRVRRLMAALPGCEVNVCPGGVPVCRRPLWGDLFPLSLPGISHGALLASSGPQQLVVGLVSVSPAAPHVWDFRDRDKRRQACWCCVGHGLYHRAASPSGHLLEAGGFAGLGKGGRERWNTRLVAMWLITCRSWEGTLLSLLWSPQCRFKELSKQLGDRGEQLLLLRDIFSLLLLRANKLLYISGRVSKRTFSCSNCLPCVRCVSQCRLRIGFWKVHGRVLPRLYLNLELKQAVKTVDWAVQRGQRGTQCTTGCSGGLCVIFPCAISNGSVRNSLGVRHALTDLSGSQEGRDEVASSKLALPEPGASFTET